MQQVEGSSGHENMINEHAYRTDTGTDNEPHTYNEAMRRLDSDLWVKVMNNELETFKKIGLYEEVEQPHDCKVIDSKWVFKIKCRPNGEIE